MHADCGVSTVWSLVSDRMGPVSTVPQSRRFCLPFSPSGSSFALTIPLCSSSGLFHVIGFEPYFLTPVHLVICHRLGLGGGVTHFYPFPSQRVPLPHSLFLIIILNDFFATFETFPLLVFPFSQLPASCPHQKLANETPTSVRPFGSHRFGSAGRVKCC